jgi:hypothetical protein
LRYGGHHPGSITDDTEQTILVAESLLDVGYLDPEDIARRLVLWLPHGTGKGTATVHAVERLGQGVPWYLAGEDSAGNGAACARHRSDFGGWETRATCGVTRRCYRCPPTAIRRGWRVRWPSRQPSPI